MWAGRRGIGSKGRPIDHAESDAFMDPRDLGIGVEPKHEKRRRAWREMMGEASFWEGKGFPEQIVRVMTQGADVTMVEDIGAVEVPQYPYASEEAYSL